MANFRAAFCRKQKAIATLCLAIALASLTASPAAARHWRAHHRHHAAQTHGMRYRHGEPAGFRHLATRRPSNIAAIVVDANSGRTLFARDENELRYPASITKVMTLYLLFEELERGRLRLDSEIPISAHAAAQKPTKLGLRPGKTIDVEDAIRAVVTRSANDIAVAIAETVGGDEENFARLMTLKAHALGMTSTHFANASGLPDPEQVTTAHDLALLGRAIQERFPRYYHYFATRAFYYRGATIVNHNHLLDRLEGMDGIKTGFTNASGFNLLASVRRNGRHIVAVVLGGSSANTRDRIMADLIEDQIDNGATVRTASAIAESTAKAEPARAISQLAAKAGPARSLAEPAVKLEPVRSEGRREASAPSAPAPETRPKIALRVLVTPDPPRPEAPVEQLRVTSVKAGPAKEQPRPTLVSGVPVESDALQANAYWNQASLSGSATPSRRNYGQDLATATPSPPGRVASAASQEPQDGTLAADGGRRPAAARNGWMIQIGATPDMSKASELLARAKSEGPRSLLRAQAFTEKIQRGSEILYRARFAGLEEESAELACKALKRSGFSCFATRN